MPGVTLTGLDVTERYLRSFGDQVAYLVLSEVVDRQRTASAARVSYDTAGLAPWLDAELADDDEPDEYEPGDVDDEATEEEPEQDDHDALVPAAMGWLRDTVDGLMTGRGSVKFKLGLYAPGGKSMLHSTRFEALNSVERRREALEASRIDLAATLPEAVLAPTVGPPPPRPGPFLPEEQAWRALGDGYTQLIALTQSTYAHVAKLQSASIASLAEQNGRLHGIVEELSDDLRSIHVGAAQASQEEKRETAASQVRANLGKQFIDQLGGIGRLLASTQTGMSPELTEVVESIGRSPEILEVLKAPAVRALLKDEQKRADLALLLRMAIEQFAGPEAAPDAAGLGPDGAAAPGGNHGT